jgi:hypothetical protein
LRAGIVAWICRKEPPRLEGMSLPLTAQVLMFIRRVAGIKGNMAKKAFIAKEIMFRFKKTFGFNLQHKTHDARRNEIITKINLT